MFKNRFSYFEFTIYFWHMIMGAKTPCPLSSMETNTELHMVGGKEKFL
jgi:hypothetical protein